MLDEPYRWVEAIRNRREYLEDQLRSASPVVASAYDDGIMMVTTTPGPRKLFEIHNQIAFATIGHPADIEKLRKAVIDIAHVESFNLSPRDVSLQRLVNFGLGPLMKSAFDEIFRSPYIARVLVAELDPADAGQTFYTIDADGSFSCTADAAALGGRLENTAAMVTRLTTSTAAAEATLSTTPPAATRGQALERALESWAIGRLHSEAERDTEPTDDEIADCIVSIAAGPHRLEAAVLDRSLPTKTKFRLLSPEELDAGQAGFRR